MSKIGDIEWRDLTVENAGDVSDFYSNVVGWQKEAASMGDYEDFNMNLPANGETIAGICHSKGPNSNMPAQWLMYVRVEDVKESAKYCEKLGGSVIEGPRMMGDLNFCVIKDPAGAVLGLVSN